MIQIELNVSEIQRELARLSTMPSAKDKAVLDAVLDAAFGMTQAQVHVDTGHLKATGTVSSYEDGHEYVGEISYGEPGDAHWEKDPTATYAVFERARGGPHNFFAGLEQWEALFGAAVRDTL